MKKLRTKKELYEALMKTPAGLFTLQEVRELCDVANFVEIRMDRLEEITKLTRQRKMIARGEAFNAMQARLQS